jgi:hypothetical protein
MDRTSKVLMALIAAGLWANLAIGTLAPREASAGSSDAQQILMHVQMIANGICVNRKIC